MKLQERFKISRLHVPLIARACDKIRMELQNRKFLRKPNLNKIRVSCKSIQLIFVQNKGLRLWCLMLLSITFQFYCGCQFCNDIIFFQSDHRCLWTGHSIPPFFIFFLHFHGLEICKTAIICRFLIASVD